MRSFALALPVLATLLHACANGDSPASSTSPATPTVRFFEIVRQGCLTEPAHLDARGLTGWRFVIAFPPESEETCAAHALDALEDETARTLARQANLDASSTCVLPEVTGDCVDDLHIDWCYGAARAGETCAEYARVSIATAQLTKDARFFVIF
jgi:hypothetical protein